MNNYPTNLTRKRRQFIKRKTHKKSGKTSFREIINAIFFPVKSRMLPAILADRLKTVFK